MSRHMRDLVQVEVPVLGEAATHLFAGSNSGGKKIRATMVLLTARAFRKGRGRSFRLRPGRYCKRNERRWPSVDQVMNL